MKNEQINEIINKYINGENSTDLSKKYNLSITSVLRLLKKNNIRIRTQSEIMKKRYNNGFQIWNKGIHVRTNTGRTHFKKGQISLNKGKKGIFKHTKKTKEKMSEIHKKMKLWNRGLTKYNDERIRKIGEYNSTLKKGKEVNEGLKQRQIKGKFIRGKSPSWKGGLTPITRAIRHSNKYNEWRRKIFIRDNFTCLKCGQIGGYLEVHHKKSFYKFIEEIKINLPLLDLYEAAMIYTPLWDISNGETLCKKCHPNFFK